MSGPSPSRQLSGSKEIPTRKMVINDPSQLPDDYSTTPNGTTWFSTTPGGTRIIYERKFLMNLRNSPLARTPPANLPIIPGVTVEAEKAIKTNGQVAESKGKETVNHVEGAAGAGDEPQFQMDI